jgi:hypothetical protein
MAVLDAVMSLGAAAYLYYLRQKLGHYFAMAFVGVALEAVSSVVTLGVSPNVANMVVWVTITRIIVRLIKGLAIGMLLLYLLGYINGKWSGTVNMEKE